MPDHTPTSVAFATQKGGAGKSTSLTLLASYLFFKRDASVIVIDADFPQHSLQQLRNTEKQLLGGENGNREFQREFLKYGKTPIYPILSSRMDEVFKRSVAGQASAFEKAAHPAVGSDYILIDTPGSLAVDGILDIMARVDRIVVPLEPEQMSLASTSQFIAAVNAVVPPQERAGKIVAFWNKIRWRSHSEIIETQNAYFRPRGVHVLRNFIPESVKLKRSETRSTVLPVNFASLDLKAFMDELTQAL